MQLRAACPAAFNGPLAVFSAFQIVLASGALLVQMVRPLLPLIVYAHVGLALADQPG